MYRPYKRGAMDVNSNQVIRLEWYAKHGGDERPSSVSYSKGYQAFFSIKSDIKVLVCVCIYIYIYIYIACTK